jgi:hypothetical protein
MMKPGCMAQVKSSFAGCSLALKDVFDGLMVLGAMRVDRAVVTSE